MAWTTSRDIFAEQNIKDTNILLNPWGKGLPASSKEYNLSSLLRTQAEQELYRSTCPSGVFTHSGVKNLETTTDLDINGEIVTLSTNNLPLANTIRLGYSECVVNGWKVKISNTDGTNGQHNNITLSAAPSSGSRLDLVFLEVWIAELGGTSATISNTSNKPSATTLFKYGNAQYRGTNVTDDIAEIDAELNRRWQLQYRIRTVEGVDIDTYPDGVDHSTVVKAWGTNPGSAWTGSTSGVGSAYAFINMGTALNDTGLYRAGDGDTTSKSVLGTVDGFVYAIPVCAVFRRNTGVYDVANNPTGTALIGPTGGSIASAVSGRPDGYYYDQIVTGDIVNLRHLVVINGFDYDSLASEAFDKAIRGNLMSNLGKGDGVGASTSARGSMMIYAQGISNIDQPGINDAASHDTIRRVFSDTDYVQATELAFTGAPAFNKPWNLAAPASAPTGTSDTSSGTLAAGTYYVKTTYTNPFYAASGGGETQASAESTGIVLASTGRLNITAPATVPNATGYNVYVTTTSGSNWRRQNVSPVPLGSNYFVSVPLVTSQQADFTGTVAPTTNTAQAVLSFPATALNATVVGVDGNALYSTAANTLPNGKNAIVYNFSTNTEVVGTWSGSGTATATFKPTADYSANDLSFGVITIVGIKYPAGNGVKFRPERLMNQNVIISGTTYKTAQLGVTGIAAADDAHLNTPSGTFIDSTGNLYVADTANHRIVKYNASLVKQAQFPATTGIAGSGSTGLSSPASVVVDSSGNIYVSDTGNNRIVKLNSSLAYSAQYVGTTNTLNTPLQIALDSTATNLYIADSLNKRIMAITTAGLAWVSNPVGTSANVVGVAVDSTGNIFVSQGNVASKFSSGGVLQYSFGINATSGSDNYKLNTAGYITLNNGYVYVADTANHRIVKLNSFLIYTGQFGVPTKKGFDLGHLNSVKHVSFDATGLLYIADSGNHRMLRVHPNMGALDPQLKQFEVLAPAVNTTITNFWYEYRPYQGVIGAQGSTTMNYTLRAVTDLKAIVTTCGSWGRNASIEDNLNGLVTRMPLPLCNYGSTPTGNELEFKFKGDSIAFTGGDSSAILADPSISWGGQMATYAANPDGNGVANLLAGNQVKISQNTFGTGYPNRGVNTIQRFVENSVAGSGWDALAMSFGTTTTSTEKLNLGYFLAVASGGGSSLPVIKGELVLVVVAFRTTSNFAAIYGQTSAAVAVDVYRIPGKPLVRY